MAFTFLKAPINMDQLLKWQVGLGGEAGVAPINVSTTLATTDWIPPDGFHARMFTASGGSKLYVDWSDGTLSLTNFVLPVEPMMPYWNIAKIYKSGTDATDLIAWPAIQG